jgi:predicted kinase
MASPRLVLLCGLPGSGKTTLARRMEKAWGMLRFCPDEWMTDLGIDLWDIVARAQLEERLALLAKDLLQHGVSVILEYGFWSRAERDAQHEAARSMHAFVELYYLNPSREELFRRLIERNQRGARGTAIISPSLVAEWAPLLMAPDAAEFARYDRSAEIADSLHYPL